MANADDNLAEEFVRPQTSTRDPAELRDRLEAWITLRLPDGARPHVSALEVPANNGLSSETVIFDVTWHDAGRTHVEGLVARLAPSASAVPVFPDYDLERQFRVMQLVRSATTVPVPRVRWSEPDPNAVGSPFFVMERIDGRVPPDLMPYNFGSWLTEASAGERRRLQDATIGVLASLHDIPDANEDFAFLDAPRPEPTALARHAGEQWSYYEWVADGLRSPLLERCFAWLHEHWPADESPTVLSWGDSRIGNVIYRDFEPVAVLDWEMATLGPRELDVAWLIYLHRFFEDVAAQYGLPGLPDFLRRDDVATAYESITGYAPRDLDFYTLYAATRHGIIMSRIQRRSIHFGEAAMPDDVDDLIAHRATLEAMLDGTYWTH